MNNPSATLPDPLPHWRILLVEDNLGDADLIREIFDEEKDASLRRILHVSTLKDALKTLREGNFDAVILDLSLPDAFGVECIRAIRDSQQDVPIVVLTGVDDDRLAVACIAAGAHDYLRKSDTFAKDVRRAVGFAVARYHELVERSRAHALQMQLAAIVESSSDAIVTCSPDGLVMSWNRGAEKIFGNRRDDVIGRPLHQFIRGTQKDKPVELPRLGARKKNGKDSGSEVEIDCLGKDGALVTLAVIASRLRDMRGAFIGLAMIFRDVTESKRREHELRLRNSELMARERQMQALTGRLHSIREAERTRISHEVHDELGQMLTGVKMDLRWIYRRLEPLDVPAIVPITARIAEAEKMVDSTIETVQRIAIELRPSVLDAIGLGPAIRDEARRFEARASIAVEVRAQGWSEPCADVATTLFRIYQELMTNVARHAHATRVHVDIEATAEAWILRVEDDGIGMPSTAMDRPSSLGLLGIRERAASLGGIVSFGTKNNQGTVVTVTVPRVAQSRSDACATS